MKTNYTDQQLQAAIDAACKETHTQFNATLGNSITISPKRVPTCWGDEHEARLHLLKSALDHLPEPPPPVVPKAPRLEDAIGATPGSFAKACDDPKTGELPDPYAELKKAHAEGKVIQSLGTGERWIGLDLGIKDPLFYANPLDFYRIKPEPETFEAHGKTWISHNGGPMPCDGDAIIQCLFAYGDVWNAYVPAKDVRWSKSNGIGDIIGWRYADEPTSLVTKPDSLPKWTPAVGDLVQLKSGGPVMTFDFAEHDDVYNETVYNCMWIKPCGNWSGLKLPLHMLKPAKEEQP